MIVSEQGVSGVQSLVLYSTQIFSFAGVKEAILATALVGTVNLGFTWTSAFFVDHYGRKTMLLIGAMR